MLNSVFITLNGKYVVERRMEAISNNLANASTAGYKASKPAFKISEESARTGEDKVTLSNTTINDLDIFVNFSEAPLIETGNKLDIAIQGNGFFSISTPDGTLYTRNGQFTIDKDKKLVSVDGNPVMGQNGEITLDGKEIMIEADGSIYVDKRLTGTLKIVDFKDRTSLKNFGRSSFINTNPDNPETTPEKITVKSGAFEASNVNVMAEMVDMMSALRAYESYTKVDQSLNDVMSKLLDIVR